MIRLTMIFICFVGAARAQDQIDPDWPCIQRRQPQLSVAQVWAGPVPDDGTAELARDPAIQRLALAIAPRRTSLEDATSMIDDFAQGADNAQLAALFLAVFDQIQSTRNRVMTGITRYAHKQEALDDEIEGKRHEFTRLMQEQNKDFDAIDALEVDIDWSTRIFQDRQQALTYVCETPVILEQRAFAIGRAIAAHLTR